MTHLKSNEAISEIVGTVLILGISVSLFSIVYISVLSTDSGPLSPSLDIIGTLEGNDIIIEHRGGKSVDSNANLLVDIAGIREPIQPINQYMKTSAQLNGQWDYGETLRYPAENITDLKVDVGISEINSNSLILYSNLQMGYTVPPFGRGGIWHFDEGTGKTAFDSSGNNNHGTIVNATWTSGINNTALSFNGINESVTVPDSPGLDISSEITIEAWMKPTIFPDHIIDKFTFDFTFGSEPDFVRVKNHIFAAAYVGHQSDGFLKTFEVYPDGNITDVEIDSIEYDTDQAVNPKIFHVEDQIYAIAYSGPKNDGYLKTFQISSDGDIQAGFPIDELEFDNTDCYNPDVIHVSGNTYAIAYCGANDDGFVKTVTIFPDGNIDDSIVDVFEFDGSDGYEPDLVFVSGSIYAIFYRGPDDNGIVKTIEISSIGEISDSSVDIFIFETDHASFPNVIRRTSTIYAVVYQGHNGDSGILSTINIETNGVISDSIIDSYEFEEFKCFTPEMLHFLENEELFAIAYRGGPSHTGYMSLINIELDGSIERPVAYSFEFDSVISYTPKILKLSDNVIIVIYQKQKKDGIVETLWIPGSAHPKYAGIFKPDEYALYANETTAFGYINDMDFTASISPGWNHIALVYNSSSSFIGLYVNGSLANSGTYSEPIDRGNRNLEFGTSYYGIIDEIAIFDHALTQDEILSHSDPDHAGDFN